MEQNKKVCFKSDGTKETGDKIIKALKELGCNTSNYKATDGNAYYFMYYGDLKILGRIPEGYELKELPNEIESLSNKPLTQKDMVAGEAYLIKQNESLFLANKAGYYIYPHGKLFCGGFTHIHHQKIELASEDNKKWLNVCIKANKFMSKKDVVTKKNVESIIEQAKKKYPIGSIFLDLVHNKEFTVASHDFYNIVDPNQVYVPVQSNNLGNKSARIYKDGKWAKFKNDPIKETFDRQFTPGITPEIGKWYQILAFYDHKEYKAVQYTDKWVKCRFLTPENNIITNGGVFTEVIILKEVPSPEKTESNLDKAKRLYPKGTKFKGCVSKNNFEVVENHYQKGQNIVVDAKENRAYIFLDGGWAEIIEESPKIITLSDRFEIYNTIATDSYYPIIPSNAYVAPVELIIKSKSKLLDTKVDSHESTKINILNKNKYEQSKIIH
jgi:hypothetical protein